MGKGGKEVNAADQPKQEVLIDGRFYDVTKFKHPGGSVIGYYAGKGIDASDAFSNFHIRSKRAKKILDAMPSRAADKKTLDSTFLPGQQTLLEDFHEFQRQLEKEGYFKPSPLHIAYRVFEIIAMHAIGFYFLFHNQILLGILFLGIVSGRCGWLMHEGGHNSLTGVPSVDKTLQIWIYGVGCGMSASWWCNQHNKHHSMPQKLGHDVDLNTLPLVAFTEKVAKRVGLPVKYWIRLQGFLFPIVTTLLVALGWQFYLHPRYIIRTKNVSEAASFSVRGLFFWLVLVPKFGLYESIGLYLFYTWIGATYIFLNFALSHTHLPVVPKDDTKVDWVRYASDYTMNVKPGPFKWVNWWMGYLNFQIEHHLFPSMPQFNHPIISPRVKAFFEAHGLVYDQRSYLEAFKATFQNLHRVGNEVFLG